MPNLQLAIQSSSPWIPARSERHAAQSPQRSAADCAQRWLRGTVKPRVACFFRWRAGSCVTVGAHLANDRGGIAGETRLRIPYVFLTRPPRPAVVANEEEVVLSIR